MRQLSPQSIPTQQSPQAIATQQSPQAIPTPAHLKPPLQGLTQIERS